MQGNQVTIFDFQGRGFSYPSTYPFAVSRETIVRPLWTPQELENRDSLIFLKESHAKYLWRIFTGSILRGSVDGKSIRHRRFSGSYVSYLWAFGYLSLESIEGNRRARKYLQKRGYNITVGFKK